LVEGGLKRCPACGARLKSRGRSTQIDAEIAMRPPALVERELQARIEAQTASGFRQRRRAAKAARRIAALPSSLFDAGSVIDAGSGWWDSSAGANSVVIDLPVSAIYDVQPVRVESESVQVREPEPLALVAPVIEIAPAETIPPEPEPVAETEPEPAETVPSRAHRRPAVRVEHRWRLRRTNRPVVDDPPVPPLEPEIPTLVGVDEVADVAEFVPVVDEIVPSAPVIADPDPEPEPVVVAQPEPELVLVPEPEPEPVVVVAEPEPEPVVAAEPEPVRVVPEPEPIAVEVEPEPIAVSAPEPAVASTPKPAPERAASRKPAPVPPRGAADWQPSTSLWARQVFNASSKRQQVVSWPRPYEPPADDLARDYIDAEVAEPARAD
jgi:hypothetical protein